jgi:Zn-dependent protease with chaperone function
VPRLLKALVVVLAVPLVCGAIALSARDQWDDRWQAGLRREFRMRRQPVDERVIARYSLAALCADPRSAATIVPCRSYGRFSSMVSWSAGVAGLGLCLLAAIGLAGRWSRGKRERLLHLFRPGLWATTAGIVFLVVLHGALAAGGVFLLGEVIGRWPISLVLAIGVAIVLLAGSMVRVAFALNRKATIPLVGRALDHGAQPAVARLVVEVCTAVGAEPPDRFVASLSPALFVTEADILCLDGRLTGRTLHVSLPLARILSVDEFRAALAHECSHFTGPEAGLSARFFPIRAGVVRSLRALDGVRGLRSLAVLPVAAIVSFFVDSFERAAAAIGPERELIADRTAASAAGTVSLAAALVKMHAFVPAWETVRSAMASAVAEGTQYVNASALFAELVTASAGPDLLAGIGSRSLQHPTDELPTLADRLAALGVSASVIAPVALVTGPRDPAVSLLPDHETLEQELSAVEHRLLAARRDQDLEEEGPAIPDRLAS